MANASNGNAYIPGGGGAGGGVAIAAGGATNSSGTVVFANSNGITFGNNNGTITATVTPGAAAGIAAVQAGTQTQTSGTMVFSNSNGVSFGLSGSSQLTASVAAQTAFVFSASNGLAFGTNGSTVTGSYSQSAQAFSASGGSSTFSTLNFANSNGVTFSNSAGSVVASYNSTSAVGQGTTFAGTNVSASMTLNTAGVNLALSAAAGGGGGAAISAAGGSQSTGTVVFSNSNGISFGYNAGTITATVQPGAAAGIAAVQAGTQTATSGTVTFGNSNGISFGMSGSSQITASYTVPGATVFSNSNNVSFGLNGSTVTASAQPGVSAISAGANSVSAGQVVFSNSNNVSFGLNGSTVTATATVPIGVAAAAAGTQTQTSGTLSFVNSNGLTFGMSNSSQVTASYNSTSAAGTGTTFAGANISASITLNSVGLNLSLSGGAGGGGGAAISAAGSSVNAGTVVFSNSNGVSFGMNGSTVTAQVAAAAQSATIAAVGQSTGQSSSNTVALSAFNVSGSGIISVGMSGNTLIISGPQTTNFANLSISAGTTSGSLGSLVFSNSNGVSFGLNGSTITASAAGGGGGGINAGVSNLGNTAGSTGTVSTGNVVFVGSGAISLSQSTGAAGSAATISILGPATSSLVGIGQISISSAGATISVIGAPQLSFFNAQPYGVTNTVQIGQGSIHVAPIYDAEPFSASRADFFVSNTLATGAAVSLAGTLSAFLGLYSRNGSTLSLASSGSQSYVWTNTSNNSLGSLSGIRAISVPLNVNYTGGDIWVGVMSQTASAGSNSFTMSNCMAALPLGTQLAGLMGQASNNTYQYNLGLGLFSTTSNAMPASMAFSAITGQGSGGAGPALSVVPMRFANFTV